ncbi:citrate synthase/methylcitrate synthase [Chloroflexi bacterium TSY]|nr:citrate synthase/methylcitrate synthase [Chloroflexi bacterium TSY]
MHDNGLTNGYKPGLEGVIAAETSLSKVDGQNGQLTIGGFALEELAPYSTFEEAVYLLWHGHLPTASELTNFSQKLAEERTLPSAVISLLAAAAAAAVPEMDALRMATSALTLEKSDEEDALSQAQLILGRLPSIVAAYERIRRGEEPIEPNATLGHAANYLYMLTGNAPAEAQVRGLETYLNAVIDHGLNASTFTARVIIATDSDLISAVTGAIGALKGPRHGGAPAPALDMVFEIGTEENAEPYLRAKIERRELLMGFGHRVYKVRDPRADVLAGVAEGVYQSADKMPLYNLAKHVERTAVELLAEYKPHAKLQTNVEFYTALLLHGIGLENQLFTPTFAISRAAGWIAHCFEQQAANRVIRPSAKFVGEVGRKWVSVENR